ncbi:low-density lipoprotein receptor-related protein 11-like isoform X2 [Mizuhopecten yessoensis]|uniref:low-density lipoprotein receptor-related protein 11-like isoform X2 n=1 Tax=Mizuhopecten yessoensis TaxID=6573 RepID=UPI000B4573B2|nr:low-density lipoprotein receptor-related protein 11-like isoform X2 [Mizuhopecten yessoensis]
MKMKIIFIFVILVLSVHSKDEELPSLQELLNDPDLMKIIKRLGITGDDLTRTNTKPAAVRKSESASDVDLGLPEKPKPTAAPSTIKPEHVTDSVGNSCFYSPHESTIIRSQESMKAGSHFLKSDRNKTRHDCIISCCYTQGCTLAVFEDKDNHTCYLFNCGGNNKCVYAHHANYVSMTLQASSVVHGGSLGQDNEGDLKGLGEVESPHPSATPQPTPVPQKIPVPIFGECDPTQGKKCLDFNAECKQGICQCTSGFRAEQGVCYFHKKEPPVAAQTISQAPGQAVTRKPVKTVTEKVSPTPFPKTTPQPTKEKVDTVDKKPSTHEETKTEKTQPKVTEVLEKTESKTAPKPTVKVEPVTSNNSKSASNNVGTEKGVTNPTKAERVEVAFGEEDGLVIVEAPTDSSQGPIVALALGLGVTMMLLIYVGCRLRNVKRRIRKGRALHSNEADYLINGMYL